MCWFLAAVEACLMHTDSQCPAVAGTEADGTGPGLRRGTQGARAARDTRESLSRSSRPLLYIYQGRGVNENDGRRNAREGGEEGCIDKKWQKNRCGWTGRGRVGGGEEEKLNNINDGCEITQSARVGNVRCTMEERNSRLELKSGKSCVVFLSLENSELVLPQEIMLIYPIILCS